MNRRYPSLSSRVEYRWDKLESEEWHFYPSWILPCVAFPVAWPCASSPLWLPILCSTITQHMSKSTQELPYPRNDLLYSLFMTFHLQKCLDLTDRQVLSVTQCDKLVEGRKKLVCILQDFPLIQGLAGAGNDLGEEVQRVDVLEDIRLAVGDEDHVKLIEGLVDEAHIVLLNSRMLGS